MRPKFELSVWKDLIEGTTVKEQKIAILGSHTMDTPFAAYDVAVKKQINGEKTLTFSIITKVGEEVNPFLQFLVAERKVKLRDGDSYPISKDESGILDLTKKDVDKRWTDYNIKEVKEDSKTKINTYICKESHISELGKNGWEVLLDTELANNYGTITELATKALESSQWILDSDKTYEPRQVNAEALFGIDVTGKNLKATKMIADSPIEQVLSGWIYFFYSDAKVIENSSGIKVWRVSNVENQILYKNGKALTNADLDDNSIVIDNNQDYNFLLSANDDTHLDDLEIELVEGIQGNKVISTIESHFEPLLDKNVYHYKATQEIIDDETENPVVAAGDEVFNYKDMTYATSALVSNYIANGTSFISDIGWLSEDLNKKPTFTSLPKPDDSDIDLDTWKPTNYLVMTNSSTIYNEGLHNNHINFIKGNKYVIRIKARRILKDATDYIDSIDDSAINNNNALTISIGKMHEAVYKPLTDSNKLIYTVDTSTDSEKKGYATETAKHGDVLNTIYNDDKGYCYVIVEAIETIKGLDEVVFAISSPDLGVYQWHLTEVQVFDFYSQVIDIEGVDITRPIFPDDTPEAFYIEKENYFTKIDNEIYYLPNDSSYYAPVITQNSVRSIEIKESNYFNILNSLAELFEVWVNFEVEHYENGEIVTNEAELPVKKYYFSQFNPNDEYVDSGIKYGINLNGLVRDINSSNIVTKLIVKDNLNEYAVNGICTVREAINNPTKDINLYNFDYYVNMGLLNQNQLLADLYGLSPSDLSYYPNMYSYNTKLIENNQLLVEYQSTIDSANEMLAYIDAGLDAANTEIAWEKDYYEQLKQIYKVEIEDDEGNIQSVTDLDHKTLVAKRAAIAQLQAQIDSFEVSKGIYQDQIDVYTEIIAELEPENEQITEEKKLLEKSFRNKYASFLQEGTWTDNQYIDNDLYYLDAANVLNQNHLPQISYNITPAYLNDKYHNIEVGQKTYVEDTEFFGWKNVLMGEKYIKTPIRKEVIVSEKIVNLSDPSKNAIVVRTYKNQFEELFSQITNTTTSLQYSAGGFNKAANVIESDGSVKIGSIESAIQNNAFILANSKNQSVTWDSGRGIEVTDLVNSSAKVRITSNGIMMTIDGGKTWINGLTPNGINTHFLQAGRIAADKINIMSKEGDYAFTWNEDGLSAFSPDTSSKYVRFNNLGLFGTKVGETLDNALKEATSFSEQLAAIKEYSTFTLNWDGLFINGDGSYDGVSLDSLGLQVYNGNTFEITAEDGTNDIIETYSPRKSNGDLYQLTERFPVVTIGKYYDDNSNGENSYYGLVFRNSEGKVTLQTDNTGSLHLNDTLTVGNLSTSFTQKKEYQIVLSKNISEDTLEYAFRIPNILIKDDITGTFIRIKEENEVELAFEESNRKDSENYVTFTFPADETSDAFFADIDDRETCKLSWTGTEQYYNYLALGDSRVIDNENIDIYTMLSIGHTNPNEAPLQILSDGSLYATKASIQGHITALTGEFLGNIKVGDSAGINGDITAKYSFWSGKENSETEPTFYVTPEGKAYASNLEIVGKSTFAGVLKAATGDFGKINFGNSESYISGEPGTAYFINIGNNFTVSPTGHIVGETLSLCNDNIKIGDSDGKVPITIYNPITKTSVFQVDNTGNLLLDGILKSEDLELSGALKVGGITIQNAGDTSIGSKIYCGEAWKINGDGSAFFSNVNVSGKISTMTLEQDKVIATNGTIQLTPSFFLTEDLKGVAILDEEEIVGYEFDILSLAKNSSKIKLWKNVTEVSIQMPTEPNQASSYIKGIVESTVNDNTGEIISLTVRITELRENILKGSTIISKTKGINSILLTANNDDGPQIIMTDSVGKKVIIGTISEADMINTDLIEFSDANPVYNGLYADNAFITGRVYLPNAGITNEDTSINGTTANGDKIRFWAGAEPADKANAPFIVTQDGSLYASKGIFSGTIEAENSTFSGNLKSAGVLLENNSEDDFYFRIEGYSDTVKSKYDNTIVDISARGVDFVKGEVNFYSDYYENTSTAHYYNEYDEDGAIVTKAYPAFSFLDEPESTEEGFISRGCFTNLQIWQRLGINEYSSNLTPTALTIKKGRIISTEEDYKAAANRAWDSYEEQFKIGEITDGLFGIKAKDFRFYTPDEKNNSNILNITLHTINAEPTATFAGNIKFKEVVTIKQNDNGIAFMVTKGGN